MPLHAPQVAGFHGLWGCTNDPAPRLQLAGQRPLLLWHAHNLRIFRSLAAFIPPAAEPPRCLCLSDCPLRASRAGQDSSFECSDVLAQFTGLFFVRDDDFNATVCSPSTSAVAALLKQMPNLQCVCLPDDSHTFRRTELQPFLDRHFNHHNLRVLPSWQALPLSS